MSTPTEAITNSSPPPTRSTESLAERLYSSLLDAGRHADDVAILTATFAPSH